MEKSIRTWWSVQYDGTNSADVLAVANKTITSVPVIGNAITRWVWDITSSDANQVTIRRTDQSGGMKYFVVNNTDWFLVRGDSGVAIVISSTAYNACFSSIDEITTSILTTAAMQAALQESGAFGIATVPSLAGNQSSTVQVTVKPARTTTPDASDCAAILYGSVSLLASLSVTAVAPFSGSRIDVTVKNTGLLTLSGGSVFVHVA